MIRKASMILSALALCAFFATAGFAKEITIRGKLQKTVEANGWLIVAGKQKYLILNPEKFRNEKWFAEAREVEATGEVKKGVVSIYMEGTPFDVHSMRPFGQNESQATAPSPVLTSLPVSCMQALIQSCRAGLSD